MTFRHHEIEFLRGTALGRLATIQPNGTLQNSPVGYSFNETLGTIDIFGFHMSKSQKYRNIASNDKVAFVVDDIASVNPWTVRCFEVRGTAEALTGQNPLSPYMSPEVIRIHPRRIIGFGIDNTDIDPHLLEMDARNV